MSESPWKRACAKLPTEALITLGSAFILDLKDGANVDFIAERLFVILDELGSRLLEALRKEMPSLYLRRKKQKDPP